MVKTNSGCVGKNDCNPARMILRGPELGRNRQRIDRDQSGHAEVGTATSLVAVRKGTKREGRKGSKSNGRRDSLRTMHPDIFVVKTRGRKINIYLTARATFDPHCFPASLDRVHGDASSHRVSFPSLAAAGGRVRTSM